ncbi:hypothetical protein [Tenacibaculum sp. 190524A05c]|uniref:hypothetical protein n=1 Tax=Tenacibaculum platacis TaxID=3137852 RepID=UPI0031FB8609
MKKSFFLPKGLEKFSNKQINDLSLIKGGAIPTDDDVIYYPTSGGGGKCPHGQVWSHKLQRCVAIAEKEEERFRL